MRRLLFLTIALTVAMGSQTRARAAEADAPSVAPKNNPFGMHLLIQDRMTDGMIETHLSWTRQLTGAWGHAKSMIYPITVETPGAQESWKRFIRRAYEMELIPVLRMDEHLGNRSPDSPGGTYGDIAAAYARVTADLIAQNPTDRPLWLEIRNEPNNANEWSNAPDPEEYGRFYVAVARAVRALGDDRIRVCNGALSPGGSYNNLEFIDALCQVPGFVTSLDGWTTHPYPGNAPPDINLHDGTASSYLGVIDGYVDELKRLEAGGVDVRNLPILITETGYNLGGSGGIFPTITEANRAEYWVRTFRDYWGQWPEILCACPYYMLSPFATAEENNAWVKPGAGLTDDGYPTEAHEHYWAVAALAKPFDAHASLSGVVRDSFGNPIPGAVVRADPGEATAAANAVGFYILGRLAPGDIRVSVQAEGHRTASASLTATAAGNLVWNPNLELTGPFGAIAGTIADDETGEGLPHALIDLQPGGMQVRSGSDGLFAVRGVRPGTYRLLVRKSEYDLAWIPDVAVVHGATVAAGARLSANRLVNGGMEPVGEGTPNVAPHWGIANWQAHQDPGPWFFLDGTNRKSGMTAQRIEVGVQGEDNNIWQFSGYSDVVAGATYTAEVWCETLGLTAGKEGGARLEIEFYTNDMEFLSEGVSPWLSGNSRWQRLQVTATAPERAGRINVVLRTRGTGGSAWFDDALMRGPRPERD